MVWSFLILNKDKKSKVVLFYSLISPLKKKVGLALPLQVPGLVHLWGVGMLIPSLGL